MNLTLIKGLLALVPALVVFSGSFVLFPKETAMCSFLQLFGAGGLVLVPVSHVYEALHLFPRMHWGLEQSVGHYLDLCWAALGLTLFPVGYLLHALAQRHV